nr:DivIVA domain-containing protein [Actinorugispora endophytica]
MLVVVAVVVMGHGGQLARFEADHPPLDLPADRPVTGHDVARVRLPLALWGYHVRAVDELLARVAAAVNERDAHIAQLEARLAEHGASAPAPRVWYPRPSGGSSPAGPREKGPSAADDPEAEPPVPAWAGRRDDHGGGDAAEHGGRE